MMDNTLCIFHFAGIIESLGPCRKLVRSRMTIRGRSQTANVVLVTLVLTCPERIIRMI